MQNKAFVNEENELDVIDIQKINESITFQNCHLVVEYLRKKKPQLMEAIILEFEAQTRFGDKDVSMCAKSN